MNIAPGEDPPYQFCADFACSRGAIFALSLKPVGFYFATPFFIALIIVIFGERRWTWILGITTLLYALLLGLFMVILNAPLPQGNVSPFYDYSAFILRLNNDLQQLW